MNPQAVKQLTPKPERPAKALAIRVSQERSTRDPMPCTWVVY